MPTILPKKRSRKALLKQRSNSSDDSHVSEDSAKAAAAANPAESKTYNPLACPTAPINAKEAYTQRRDNPLWKQATFDEYDKFIERNAWTIVDKRNSGRLLRTKNVSTWQDNTLTKVTEARARNVVLVFLKREGLDYTEAFSPTPTDQTIRLHLGLSLFIFSNLVRKLGEKEALKSWGPCNVFDVDAAFLNTPTERPMFIHAPPIFIEYCKQRGIKYDENHSV